MGIYLYDPFSISKFNIVIRNNGWGKMHGRKRRGGRKGNSGRIKEKGTFGERKAHSGGRIGGGKTHSRGHSHICIFGEKDYYSDELIFSLS